MSHSKKNVNGEESMREKEPPAHRTRREFKQTIDDYVGLVDPELFLEEEAEIKTFEPIRRKKK